ncbi:MAG: CDP-alcohol phosphatidyltransferase family protein [Alphaproteobacteria bacterium]
MSIAHDNRIAIVIARALARTPVSPNAVTAVVLLLGIGAGFLFASGERWLVHLAPVPFMLAMLGDHVDGNLARLTGKGSTFGHYFDHAAMATAYAGMFVGAGIGLSSGWLGVWAIVLGGLAGVSAAAIFGLRIGVEIRAGKEYVAQPNFLGFEPEDTLYIVGPVTWLGVLGPFVIAAGIGTPVFLLYIVWQSRRQLAEAATKGRGG